MAREKEKRVVFRGVSQNSLLSPQIFERGKQCLLGKLWKSLNEAKLLQKHFQNGEQHLHFDLSGVRP